tara:strand:+ start:527 stop:715 length:189 start_codon:yes stop_codon:yes gene_type:complete
MENITELRKSLSDNYEKMKSREMEIKEGKELSNCAGKIIQSLKVELEYQTLLGTTKEIDYLK